MNQPTPNEVCSPLNTVLHNSATNLMRVQSLNGALKALIDSLDCNARLCGKDEIDAEPKVFPGVVVALKENQEVLSAELDDLDATLHLLKSLIG